MKKIVSYNWLQIDCLINNIYQQLIDDYFYPDLIIGIARGGLIPATNLSYLFNCRNIGVIQYQRTSNDKPFSLINNHNRHIGEYLPKGDFKNILIVDDIIVKGIIFEDAIKLIKDYYPTSLTLRGAFIFNQYEGYLVKNMVYASKLDKDIWVVYPWEKTT